SLGREPHPSQSGPLVTLHKTIFTMSKNRQPLLPTVTGKPATDRLPTHGSQITANKLNIK
ncbi:hypothetical protein, partial [Niveispirillum sp. SYP-B3756]|uniref:hypothetical protein n=1 Tax=Niveispirillum sp. SYP-B3756 TaxID=2662178 RepID=UPI001B3BDF13